MVGGLDLTKITQNVIKLSVSLQYLNHLPTMSKHPAYLRAIAARRAISVCGVKIGDTVTHSDQDYIFLGIAKGGKMKIRPLSGGKMIVVNPLGVKFKGEPVQRNKPLPGSD